MRGPNFLAYRLVSFDVFDTLVARLVSRPKDVFALVELRAQEAGMPVSGFAEKRDIAERAARANGKPEITLDEIYAELGNLFHDNVDVEMLKSWELEVERSVCVAKPSGKVLYEAAIESGACVVVTSDMYLPRIFVEELLASCGYSGWERCFVSCESGATKASGELYGIVAEEMCVKHSEMLHIGDNAKSDILRARTAGIAAYRVEGVHPDAHGLAESVVFGSQVAAGEVVGDDGSFDLECFGYRSLGPVLVGFCEWLTAELYEEGIRKVFYLARDGLVVREAMRVLGMDEFEDSYLYVSRRALQVPSFALLENFTDIVHSMFLPRMVSLRRIFEKIGLDGDVASAAMNDVGIDPDAERPSVGLSEDSDALRAYDILAPFVKENSSLELELLIEYLKQVKFEGRVAIVDIGWFGNMQIALERVCEAASIDVEIFGFYIGLSPEGMNQRFHRMRGYLFDTMHDRDLFESERCYNLIFETLVSATHGTTRGYRKVGDIVEPVLADYTGPDAEVGFEAEIARGGALRFAADWQHIFRGRYVGIEPAIALHELDRIGIEPTKVEARYLGNWVMESDGNIIFAAKPQRLTFYFFHPKQLMADFAHASWKIGFLKRLFRVALPYGSIWMTVHMWYERKQK